MIQFSINLIVGGSTQITWLLAKPGETLQTSDKGSISFPYGAAAMTRLLSDADKFDNPDESRTMLRSKIVSQFREAFTQLKLPPELLQRASNFGLTLYLSGGGFRGWGYLLMASHRIRPYPIPIINGFMVSVRDFKDTTHISDLALQSLLDRDTAGIGIFRVSKRRAAQVPAVAFLVDALTEAMPTLVNIRFCQGGVREGWLFDKLPLEIRAQDPLVSTSSVYARNTQSVQHFANLLIAAIPENSPELDRMTPNSVRNPLLLQAFANLLFLQQGQSKENVSVNAIMVPITGALASTHGVGHEERALLALMLAQRWGGAHDLPAPHGETAARLELLLKSQEVWWARYLGVVGSCIGEIYPAGRIVEGKPRIALSCAWSDGLGKKGLMQGVVIKLKLLQRNSELITKEVLSSIVEQIEDMGKKKNRAGGREYGFGVTLRVDIE